MCLECSLKIPVTNYHLLPYDNPLTAKLIDLEAPIERAAAYYFYKKGNPYALLIQAAKYSNQPDIARILARNYAISILNSGFFDAIDAIVPVPIHWRKHLKRGYNQTHYLAAGVSEATNIPVAHLLKANRPHETQTRKSGSERRSPLDSIFEVDQIVQGSIPAVPHLLLVDDVITTGSTILSCARILHRAIPGLRLSILSLATSTIN